MIHRRLFIGGMLGVAVAPAIVKATSLMRVVPVARVESLDWLCFGGGHGDGTCYGFIRIPPLMAPIRSPYPASARWSAGGATSWEVCT